MQVTDIGTTSTFKQVIYVLSNMVNMILFFQICKCLVSSIRFTGRDIVHSLLVKVKNEISILRPTFLTCQIFDLMFAPQSTTTSESRNAAFGGKTSTTKHHHFFFHFLATSSHYPRHLSALSAFLLLIAKVASSVPRSIQGTVRPMLRHANRQQGSGDSQDICSPVGPVPRGRFPIASPAAFLAIIQ